MTNSIQQSRNILKAGLLLVLFLLCSGSISLFPHSHTVNGIIITHSHPYNKETNSPNPGHNHSNDELVLINSISNITIIAASKICGLNILFDNIPVPAPALSTSFVSAVSHAGPNLLRAPPSFF